LQVLKPALVTYRGYSAANLVGDDDRSLTSRKIPFEYKTGWESVVEVHAHAVICRDFRTREEWDHVITDVSQTKRHVTAPVPKRPHLAYTNARSAAFDCLGGADV
jgi:hypothetical protein